MKQLSQMVSQTLGTLGSLPRQQQRETASEQHSPSVNQQPLIRCPCETLWQRKWLRLDCHCQEIQEMATAAQAFCKRWFYNSAGPTLFVLAGNPSVGKTHLAASIFTVCSKLGMKAWEAGGWSLIGHVPCCSYCSWPVATDCFKAGAYGALEDYLKADLLVIDDIGAEHDPSKNAADKLCQILSARESKFTVITTNIPPGNWAERFDVRIADRLLRNSEVIDLFSVKPYTSV